MPPPRRPRDPNQPRPPRTTSADKPGRPARPAKPQRPKSPAAAARDARRAEQFASEREPRPNEARPTETRPADARPKRAAAPTSARGAPRTERQAAPARPQRKPHAAARPTAEAQPERPSRRGAGRMLPAAPRKPAKPNLPAAPGEGERIAKLLARAGVASRRDVERMILEGRVMLDGVVIETPATILRSLDNVTVDGHEVSAPEPTRLFRFHKPPGVLTAERDFKGRPTIYDRLPADLPRVIPVGRLDLNTEGLLLLTTDGEFKRQLELPATGVTRSYRARTYGQISQAQLEDLMHGIEIEGVRYGPIDANLERRTGANVWIELKLKEGKNREVRRVLEHLGLQVSRLIRTSYGPIPLGDLPAGQVDEILQHDLVAFRKTLK